ncbi:tetratricopeptide repeat protein [Mesorhizobium sp. M0078]|uniref:PIN domain-containing protein n=1 Tax=Mesorhizobium sp. M0078 TaxID=2956871 RepID=UPI00333CD26A
MFRDELNDPNTVEYGRGGQDQGGIDVIGRRNGDPKHYVGVQCRRITKPLKQAKILSDCRAALQLEAGLKEIIFATTADDDTHATDAAVAVERALREEGHDLTVSLYGWGALQILIALHESAYAFFFPASVSTSAPQRTAPGDRAPGDLAGQIALQVGEQLRQMGLVGLPTDTQSNGGLSSEDPALHARIDTFRDLLGDDQPLIAEKGLLGLLEKGALDNKPWARFRIETNLGAAALDLGREPDAARRFETAHAIRPDDPNANANLALARTIQGRYAEAMELAQKVLAGTPRADHAIGYLLQAAARSDFAGDPHALIPPDLVGSAHADLGLAEFYTRRNVSDWAERNRQLALNHPDVAEFKRIGAIATLSMIVTSGVAVPGARSSISADELNAAANDMKAVAEHMLEIGFADQHDLVAYLNNAGVLLRLADRPAECEALLKRATTVVRGEPQLRRLLALSQLGQSRPKDAIATLEGDSDPESQFLAADLTAIDDPSAALSRVLAVDPAELSPALASSRWHLIGEVALVLDDERWVREAVEALRLLGTEKAEAELLLIRWDKKAGVDSDEIKTRLRAIAESLPNSIDVVTRYQVADQLRQNDLPEEAATLLETAVDLGRPGPLTTMYLQSLAAARRDEAFRAALLQAAPIVRDSPNVLWANATHAWNIGDLSSARASIEKVLDLDPADADARLLRIEILLRQNQSTEIVAELDRPLESLRYSRLKDRFRIASLLGHFGYLDRAAALAYRLFLENRDRSQAWMTLSALVIEEGRTDSEDRRWDAKIVAPNVAVDLNYDDGEKLFLVVEPDSDLRRLDNESWEPDHPLVRALMGLSSGDRFVDPSGRPGQILALRHKYIARLHYVMEHHESRFPEIFGFRKVSIDLEHPDGLNALIAELKQRHDWVKQEQETYSNGPWPLAMFAHRIGVDTIDVAAGLASQGVPLKVAIGNEPERHAAATAVRGNESAGCTLDLLAFWTGWRLKALDAIEATCGRIYLPQSVFDRLLARREQIQSSLKDGLKTARYDNGRIAATEVAPEIVKDWLEDIDKAIAWVETKASVCPLLLTDDLPKELIEFLHGGRSDIFDSVALAIQKQHLLVSDDRPVREFAHIMGWSRSAWLHQVFGVAAERRHIDFDTFIRWSADLVDSGHSYIGVSGVALARSFRIDAAEGKAPGYLYRTLSKVIGGRGAEPRSHILAVLECLRDLWLDGSTYPSRQPATGLLLERLIYERQDYVPMLRAVQRHVEDLPFLSEYLARWVRGHFLLSDTLRATNS